MKRLSIIFLSAVACSLASAHTSNEDAKSSICFAITTKDTLSSRLIYKTTETSSITITILNDHQEVKFKETIKNAEGFLRPYNLNGLPAGQYIFKIENGLISQTEMIDLRESVDGEALTMASVIKMEEGRYLFTLAGKGAEQVGVKISNEKGETLYYERGMTKEAFVRVYNLVNLSGFISFQITDGTGKVRTIVK